MADKLTLELVSPERALVSEEVDGITATGAEGEFGLLPGHSPFFTSLKPGILTYNIGQDVYYAAISKGFLEISDDKVVVLAEKAELGVEIDINAVIALKAEAEKFIADHKGEVTEEVRLTETVLEYHNARADAAKRSKNRETGSDK